MISGYWRPDGTFVPDEQPSKGLVPRTLPRIPADREAAKRVGWAETTDSGWLPPLEDTLIAELFASLENGN